MLGGIFGSIARNRMLNKQIGMLNEQKRENRDWYDRRYNEDATQRADAQAMLTHTAEMIKKNNRSAAGTAAVMGGTDESAAASKEANAKALAGTTSQIAVAGAQRKDQIEGQFREKQGQLDEKIRQLEGQKQGVFDIIGNSIGEAQDMLSSLLPV